MAPQVAGLTPCAAIIVGGRWMCGLLGHGGAGDVHRELDLHARRRLVAVKLLRPVDSRAARAALAREASALSRLHHPGVIAVYDAGMVRDHPYLVTELVDGGTLKSRIDTAALTTDQALRLGEDLSQTLAQVHTAGIAHCDIKPSNVLLDRHGRPHLADFGTAHQARSAPQHKESEECAGTAAYMAPEQVRGAQPGPQADIWALGLVLAEALAGTRMYPGAPLPAALARLDHRPARPECIPAAMAALLTQMTAGEPAARPSAQECADRLSALAQASTRAPCRGSHRPVT